MSNNNKKVLSFAWGRKFDKNYLKYKSGYFAPFMIWFTVVVFLGNFAWLIKDLMMLQATNHIWLEYVCRLSTAAFIPLSVLCKRKKQELNWVVCLAAAWWSILITFIIDMNISFSQGFTGEGWISFYFFIFVVSLVANKQSPIYISYVVYTILLIVTAKGLSPIGTIEYKIPIMRPITTGIIISFGQMIVSLALRNIFTNLYDYSEKLNCISKKDLLCDCWNRHILDEITENYELKNDATLFMIDIDNFKKTNDNLGHLVGDEVLRETAEIFKSIMRKQDLIIRYGGDEFLLVFEGIVDEDTVYQRIKEQCNKRNTNVSLSIGSCRVYGEDKSLHSALKKADQALYYSKNHGKSRLTKFSESILI